MIIGVPREIKTHEYRVGMIPGGVRALIQAGHTVLLEKDAGNGFSGAQVTYSPSKLGGIWKFIEHT
jgi:alanine dehydrogenase